MSFKIHKSIRFQKNCICGSGSKFDSEILPGQTEEHTYKLKKSMEHKMLCIKQSNKIKITNPEVQIVK